MAKKTDLEASIAGLSDVESSTYWNPREGKNVIRILPAWTTKGVNAGKFFYRAFLHYGFRAEGRNRAYPCLQMFDEHASCPACEFIDVLKEEGSEESTNLSRRLRRQARYYVNLIDRRTPGEVKIYGMRRRQMRALRGYLQDPDYGDVTDPEEGRDVIIDRTGVGLQSQYEIRIRPKTSEIELEGWEEKLHKLHKEVIEPITRDEYLKAMKLSFGKLWTKAMGIKEPAKPKDEEKEDPEDVEEE